MSPRKSADHPATEYTGMQLAPRLPTEGKPALSASIGEDETLPYVAAVEDRLRSWFQAERDLWEPRYPQLSAGFAALESFVFAGGKRLRPRFAFWGHVGAGGSPSEPALVDLGAALEFFHAFALIHDDIMDNSDLRRHQPTVHQAFAALHRAQGWSGEARRVGEGFAILIGDLAFAYSTGLLAAMPTSVVSLFDAMRVELHVGQYLDLMCAASADAPAETVADVARFKTAKYSVERPLQLGTALAGATAGPWCSRYGLAVGEAFQHRDDLLGIFGDPAVTGKPAGDDLQSGKQTLLLREALGTPTAATVACLDKVGSGELNAAELSELVAFLATSGAVEAVEAQIGALITEAHRAVADAPITNEARHGLEQLACAAAWRAH